MDPSKFNGTNGQAGGNGALASGNYTTAIGGSNSSMNAAQATADNATALGNGAQATASNSVALGQGSVANVENSVSVGGNGVNRVITNMEAGSVSSGSTDAVNGGQLYSVSNSLSAGISAAQAKADNSVQYTNGGQTLSLNTNAGAGTTISHVAAGQAATDAVNVGQLDSVSSSLSAGISAAQAKADNSVQYTNGGQTLSLNTNAGAGTTISHVAAGQAATDAVNVGQLQQSSQATLSSANNFTNQQVMALQNMMNQALTSGLCSFSNGNAVCGPDATAQGSGATAMGHGAKAIGDGTTALGTGAEAHYEGSVAIGAGAKALADPTTAVGNNAIAQGNNSVALGANTWASGDNAVALGQGSTAERANTVSVGNASTGLNRQITNVAPGTTATDVVNLGQMQGAVAAMGQDARNYAAKGIASSLAIPSIPTLAPGKNWVGAAVGTYGGQSALGVAWGYQVNANVNMGLGVATSSGSGSRPAARAQVGYAW